MDQILSRIIVYGLGVLVIAFVSLIKIRKNIAGKESTSNFNVDFNRFHIIDKTKTNQTEKIKIQEEWKSFLAQLGAINIKTSKSKTIDYAFNFPDEHPMSLFKDFRIYEEYNQLKLYASTDKPLSIFLEIILNQRKEERSLKEQLERPIDYYYTLQSTDYTLITQIIENKPILRILKMIYPYLTEFKLTKHNFIAKLTDAYTIKDVLELAFNIYKLREETRLAILVTKVSELECYACKDPFVLTEDVCDKCNAPRPRCIICLLDLLPEERENVIETPCCHTYAHYEHILKWLQRKRKCPNCGTDLSHLLNELKLANN